MLEGLEFREFHVPSIIISVIIGYQISIYFLYQYYKYKDENLDLNKLLLVHGILYGLGLTGLVIRTINSYYIQDNITNVFLNNFSHMFIGLATLPFIFVVSSKAFNEIVRNSISRAVLIIATTSFFLLFIVEDPLIRLVISLISTLLGALYMLVFYIKIIKRSTGSIKKRLILISIGGAIIMSSIFLGAEEVLLVFSQQQHQLLLLLSGPLLMTGLLIVFFGVFRFPAFLEFGWTKNLVKLFIIDKQKPTALYIFDFTKKNEMKTNSKDDGTERNLPTSLIGINDVINACINAENLNTKKIIQGNVLILFKYGDGPNSFITYALLVKKEMNSINYFLKAVKNQFQGFYKDILLDLDDFRGSEEHLFSSFDTILNNLIIQK